MSGCQAQTARMCIGPLYEAAHALRLTFLLWKIRLIIVHLSLGHLEIKVKILGQCWHILSVSLSIIITIIAITLLLIFFFFFVIRKKLS